MLVPNALTWSNVCRGLSGHRILGVFAKFWSDDALKCHAEVGHMELRAGHSFCFFHGKVVNNKLTWNYHPSSWKRISYNLPKSKASQYRKTRRRYTFQCIRPVHGKKCTVHINKVELGDTWGFR